MEIKFFGIFGVENSSSGVYVFKNSKIGIKRDIIWRFFVNKYIEKMILRKEKSLD
jgi:hypothetical protein